MVGSAFRITSTAALGLALALLVAELGERVVNSTPSPVSISKGRYRLSANPGVGFEPIPDMGNEARATHYMDYNETANSLGFRDYEHPKQEAEGVFRIIVLGDSIAAGHHIEHYEDAFPMQLEKELGKRGHKVEILNFGVSGYNTQQEVEILKDKGLQFQPDLVVLAYCLNDRVRSDGGILKSLLTAAKASGNQWSKSGTVLDHSRLYQYIAYRHQLGKSVPAAYKKLDEDTVEEYFRELSRVSKSDSFHGLVAIFPDFRDIDVNPLPEEYDKIQDLARDSGLSSIHLMDTVRACRAAGTRRLKRDHYHPSVAGHRCIAQGMADQIEKLIP